MVKAIHSQAMDGLTMWDVSFRVGPGSSGDDVRLVQYLMARLFNMTRWRRPALPASLWPTSMAYGAKKPLPRCHGLRKTEALSPTA